MRPIPSMADLQHVFLHCRRNQQHFPVETPQETRRAQCMALRGKRVDPLLEYELVRLGQCYLLLAVGGLLMYFGEKPDWT